MSFCGKCGAQIGEEKYCPQCGASQEIDMNRKNTVDKNSKSSKGVIKVLLGICLVTILAFGIRAIMSVSKEPCDWCGNSPSIAYKTSEGGKAYVCKECKKTCFFCGERATKHYENAFEMMVFVCSSKV